MIGDALMTQEQLAEYLGVSEEWISEHAWEMPFVRVGKSRRFPKGYVDRWLTTRYCGLPIKFPDKQF
ncbi:excisionase family DNA-binding protein [Microbispora sp. RL4-1S]|uniref:Excisionase family DNA-binding protein n=1 Tax=Microbispora oryzae TaxID=2806554 RepID=A0A941AHM5_9ACTN|nr:excisionase family DNA-binding protein [Microbispora oryzae]MBP2702882.1 excisionase family DNA-binding protein [Microbispora oryzae]